MRYLLLYFVLLLLTACASQSADPEITESEVQENQLADDTVQEEEKTTRNYGFIQTISMHDEDTSILITKNKITKTATIDTEFYMYDMENEFFDGRELMTEIGCGLFSAAFFNETAIEEFNKAIAEWNLDNATIEDDSPPEEQETTVESKEDLLEGYKITNAKIEFWNGYRESKFSECTITGFGEEYINIKYET